MADLSLDPYGEAHVATQLRLFTDLAGPVPEQVPPAEPAEPAERALRIEQLCRVFHLAGLSRDARLLVMGEGSAGRGRGLASAFATYIGLRVEGAETSSPVDAVLFCGSLRHAVRPWAEIGQAVARLRPGGQVLLAAEPVDETEWPHWGVRMDAASAGRMRASGLFEAGWSLPFLLDMLARAGLSAKVARDRNPLVGLAVIGTRADGTIPGPLLVQSCRCSGIAADGDYAVLMGAGGLSLPFPPGADAAIVHLISHRPRPVRVAFQCDGDVLLAAEVPPGPTRLRVPRRAEAAALSFVIADWVPDKEIGNGDMRRIGIHLQRITFEETQNA